MEEWVPLSEMEFSELNVPRGESESNLEPSEDLTELSDSRRADCSHRFPSTHLFLQKHRYRNFICYFDLLAIRIRISLTASR